MDIETLKFELLCMIEDRGGFYAALDEIRPWCQRYPEHADELIDFALHVAWDDGLQRGCAR
jgi:hypothetical protein